MYGFSDQAKSMPCTRFSAERQGSSRYSTSIVVCTIQELILATK
jgi:hypothetical protein